LSDYCPTIFKYWKLIKIYVIPKYNKVLVSLLQFKNDSNLLQNFTNFIVTRPTLMKNPYFRTKEVILVALANNTLWAYSGIFQEIILRSFEEYNITFKRNGLLPGTLWSVTLNGTTLSSANNTITFSEPNGTYL